jgi:hypothetical protein
MFIVMHITGGQPARGTEITGLRFANSSLRTRNIFVYDGQLMFVIFYHKSQSRTGFVKAIPRFLDADGGELLALYLVYVFPFRRLLHCATRSCRLDELLWADDAGHPWTSERVSEVMADETALVLGHRITLKGYRHIAAAISRRRTLLPPPRSNGEQVAGPRIMIEEEDEELAGDDIGDVQEGHTSRTADQLYAVRSDMTKSLNERAITLFRKFSKEWHELLGLETGRRTTGHCESTAVVQRVGELESDGNPSLCLSLSSSSSFACPSNLSGRRR